MIDLKFGQGVLVDADDNAQLSLYGWGAYNSLDWLASEDIAYIEVTICQPRRNNTVSKTFSADELKGWITENEPKARKAFRALATDADRDVRGRTLQVVSCEGRVQGARGIQSCHGRVRLRHGA